MNVVVGLLVASAVVVLPPQRFGRNPHEVGGVGAEGLIGRGTIPEERPSVLDSSSIQLAPVYVAVPVAAPTAASSRPVPVAASPSVAVSRAVPSAGQPPRARGNRLSPRQPARMRRSPYVFYDRGWLHGYWTLPLDGPSVGRDSASGVGPGLVSGWGLPAWIIGPMVYRWGYIAYANPFAEAAAPHRPEGPARYDYSQPVDLTNPPPAEARLLDALRTFHAAREAFRREDYTGALRLADEAIGLLPSDPSIHEFRGLALLAMHRYREAAAAFHAVVAVVPGWDWTTQVNLYGDVQTYTRQLRLLESYCERNPGAAAAHFLLAVQYLTMGYPDAAIGQLREAVALEPGDSLSARLLRALRPIQPGVVATAAVVPGEMGELEGTWTAHPRKDTTITLVMRPQGHVVWRLGKRGEVREYRGFGVYTDGVLTLTQDSENAMAGRVEWRDPTHFRFSLLDAAGDGPGLSFAKSS